MVKKKGTTNITYITSKKRIHMKIYIKYNNQIIYKNYVTDLTFDGCLGILNCNHKDKMDFANTKFPKNTKTKNYQIIRIKLTMISRCQDTAIFDLDNYFVLNHITPLHWGFVHVLRKQKCIACFDGYHQEEHRKYNEIKK